jgi:hypothetical protein
MGISKYDLNLADHIAPVTIVDDYSIPKETRIYYYKGTLIINLEALAVFLLVTIYFLFVSDAYLFGSIVLTIELVFIYLNFSRLKNNQPQIIINEAGIESVRTPFYKWSEISEDDVLRLHSGKTYNYYLTYKHPHGVVEIKINNYNIEPEKMTTLLSIYRSRYNN